jgi:hypothetical protein
VGWDDFPKDLAKNSRPLRELYELAARVAGVLSRFANRRCISAAQSTLQVAIGYGLCDIRDLNSIRTAGRRADGGEHGSGKPGAKPMLPASLVGGWQTTRKTCSDGVTTVESIRYKFFENGGYVRASLTVSTDGRCTKQVSQHVFGPHGRRGGDSRVHSQQEHRIDRGRLLRKEIRILKAVAAEQRSVPVPDPTADLRSGVVPGRAHSPWSPWSWLI